MRQNNETEKSSSKLKGITQAITRTKRANSHAHAQNRTKKRLQESLKRAF
ncbi:hypothetical protein KVC85_06860 [Helicobacter pylori]|nr:hypothetical protein KVC85_06860 [Helicobacter pylori]